MGKTLLIGLDGATFTVLDPLMDRGVMPFLGSLAARGVRAPLRTIMPPLTPPAWTSLMTGKRPGQHGVFDFFQKEKPDSEYFRFASSQDVHSATIWSLASDHGKRVISLNFPLMFPPPAVDGYVVPGGWMPWKQLRLGCHPPGLFDRLKTLPSFEPKELALDMKLEAKAIDGCAAEEYADWIELHTRREQRWFEILRYLVQEEDEADLVAVMFDGPDKLQHLCWRFIDPAFRPRASRRRGRRRSSSSASATSATSTGSSATSSSSPARTRPSSWRRITASGRPGTCSTSTRGSSSRATWSGPRKTRPRQRDAPQVGFSQMTRHVFELDWEQTVAYAATPSSQGINIVRQAPGSGAPMTAERYESLTAEIADGLLQIRHPVSGRPLVTDVQLRRDTFAGPYEELAPDLSLVLEDGAAVSILRSETLVRTRSEPNGNHRPEGIFVAAGPALRSGETLDELSIVDVAPLLLYSLDVPVPLDMSGRVPEEAFEPGELERRPPRFTSGAAEQHGEPSAVDVAYDGEDEETIVSRLRALGYVE